MRKANFLIVSLLGALCTSGIYAQDIVERHLTLEQMFELAEQNNSSIKAHATATRQAQEEVKVAKNAYLLTSSMRHPN